MDNVNDEEECSNCTTNNLQFNHSGEIKVSEDFDGSLLAQDTLWLEINSPSIKAVNI